MLIADLLTKLLPLSQNTLFHRKWSSGRANMPKKLRLDQLLVGKGLFASREQARRAIMAGEVMVATRIAAKPSELFEEQAPISVKPTRKYVSRGALKLDAALDHFNIEARGKTTLDIGASTGGFTDCMLQRGAKKVYAVD